MLPPVEERHRRRNENLRALTGAKQWAFKRMAMKPNDVLVLSDLKCVTETADALVAAGLAERVGGGWQCALNNFGVQDVLTWCKLYQLDSLIYVPLGIVSARQPGGPEHYVRCTNHNALSNVLEILPIQGFPGVNSKPLYARHARQEEWVLTEASESDRAKLREKGFFLDEISPLDELPIEAQMVTASIFLRHAKPVPSESMSDIPALAERFAQADAGMWAAAHAMARGEEAGRPVKVETRSPNLAGKITASADDGNVLFERENKIVTIGTFDVVDVPKLKVHQPEPFTPAAAMFEDIEFDDALIAKMMANIVSHGITLEDNSG